MSLTPTHPPQPRHRQAPAAGRGPLIVVCLATAMLMLDIAVVNTALSDIARSLRSGLTGLEWIIDAYTLTLATVVLSCGSVADRIGRRRVFAGGIVLFTASSLACGLADSVVWLDIFRALQGIGAAGMYATSLAILSITYRTTAERGKAFAAFGASIGASFAIGPLVGGALTSALGWRSVFLINVPIGVVGLVAVRRYLVESRNPNPHRIDWPGQITLTGGLSLLVLGLLRGGADGWGSPVILAELLAGAGLLFAFVAVQSRSDHPMLPLSLFAASRAFTASQVTVFAISASFFAVYLYLTLYMQMVLHLSAIETGLAYLPATIVVFLVSGASAQFGQRIAAGRLICAGLALVAVGLGLCALAGTHSSWTALLPAMLVVGIGTGLYNPAASELALSSVPERHSGLASGINDTFRQSGIPLGVAVYGALMPAAAAVGHGSPEAFVTGFHHVTWLACAIAALGAVAGGWLLRVWPQRRTRRAVAGAAMPVESEAVYDAV